MKRKGAGSNPLALNKFLENNPDPCNVKVNGLQYFSLEEIAKHNNENDAWVIYKNNVYDITHYLPFHPGGVDVLKSVLGKDCTSLFNKFHGYVNMDAICGKFQIGYVKN